MLQVDAGLDKTLFAAQCKWGCRITAWFCIRKYNRACGKRQMSAVAALSPPFDRVHPPGRRLKPPIQCSTTHPRLLTDPRTPVSDFSNVGGNVPLGGIPIILAKRPLLFVQSIIAAEGHQSLALY